MKSPSKFSPYQRKSYLASVREEHRAIAVRLCDLLEAAFDSKDIQLYAGIVIVVRDMEWIAGFAMRSAGPVAYCCSPATRAAMADELKPYMSGKSCVLVKPKKGESIDKVLALVGRAFKLASKHGGVISKTDMKKREKLRAVEGAGKQKSRPKQSARQSAKQPVKQPVKQPAAKKPRKRSARA